MAVTTVNNESEFNAWCAARAAQATWTENEEAVIPSGVTIQINTDLTLSAPNAGLFLCIVRAGTGGEPQIGRLWPLYGGARSTIDIRDFSSFTVSGSRVRIRNLQITRASGSGGSFRLGGGAVAEDCIGDARNSPSALISQISGGGFVESSLLVGSSSSARLINADDVAARRCTFVANGSTEPAVRSDSFSGNLQLAGNAFYGFVTDLQGTANSASGYNATSNASITGNFGQNGQTGLTSADFVSVNSGTEDFRRVGGSTKLGNTGTAISGVTTDFYGTSLPQGGTNDIGAHELAEAVPGPTLSAPTKSDTATTVTGGFTTTGTNGTARMVWTRSATSPSAAQVKAGQDNAGGTSGVLVPTNLTITSAGANNFASATPVTGLTYWGYVVHTDGSGNDSAVLALGPVYPGTGRPVNDLSTASYTPSSGASLAAMLNDDAVVADATKDATFITSPALTGSFVAGPIIELNKAYGAGSYSGLKARKWVDTGAGEFRIKLLDSTNAVVGQTAAQSMTTTPTTYTLAVTLTGTATRIQIEERAV